MSHSPESRVASALPCHLTDQSPSELANPGELPDESPPELGLPTDSCHPEGSPRDWIAALDRDLGHEPPLPRPCTPRHVQARLRPGAVILDRYKLLEAIGQGGMGTVWVAEQLNPMRRKVAVKLIRSEDYSRHAIARFEAERQALALMDHPNIAKVFDGGVTEDDAPFLVMEYVPGTTVTQYADRERLPPNERLLLFLKVCDAVKHAHQKGVIHRDIKPDNVLVCEENGTATPKVIDFGLAKALYQRLTDHSCHTHAGLILGTPLYMSPEQAECNNADIDVRSDVFSLGVLLYELLTGGTPIDREQFAKLSTSDAIRVLKECNFQRPSVVVKQRRTPAEVIARCRTQLSQLSRYLTRDLDWIVMKALERERSRRYDSVDALASDVRRFLNSEPVAASPPTSFYRLGKFSRRHRLAITVTGVCALALMTGATAAIWQASRALRAELERDKVLRMQFGNESLMTIQSHGWAQLEEVGKMLRNKSRDLSWFTDEALQMLPRSPNRLTREQYRFLHEVSHKWKEIGDQEFYEDIAAEARLSEARLKARMGAREDALAIVKLLLTPTEMETAIREAVIALQIDPNLLISGRTVRVQQSVARIYSDLEMYEEAELHYRKAREFREIMMRMHPEQRFLLADAAFLNDRMAAVLALRQRHDAAVIQCRQAVNYYDEYAENEMKDNVLPFEPNIIRRAAAYSRLGTLTEDVGDGEEAMRCHDKAVQILSTSNKHADYRHKYRCAMRDAYCARAQCNHRQGRFLAALADLNVAMEHSSELDQLLIRALIARSLVAEGFVEAAVEQANAVAADERCCPDRFLDCACIYSAASSARPEKREEYLRLSVECIALAARDGRARPSDGALTFEARGNAWDDEVRVMLHRGDGE